MGREERRRAAGLPAAAGRLPVLRRAAGRRPRPSQQRAVIDSNDSGWIHAYEPGGRRGTGVPEVHRPVALVQRRRRRPALRRPPSAGLRDPRGRPVRLAREGRSRPQRFLVALPPRRAQQRPVRQRHAAPGGANRDPNRAGRRRRHPPLDCAGRRRRYGRPRQELPGLHLRAKDHHPEHRPGPPSEGAGPQAAGRRAATDHSGRGRVYVAIRAVDDADNLAALSEVYLPTSSG